MGILSLRLPDLIILIHDLAVVTQGLTTSALLNWPTIVLHRIASHRPTFAHIHERVGPTETTYIGGCKMYVVVGPL